MLKIKVCAIFLAAAFLCLMPSLNLAAEDDTAWQVENFGIFQTPAKWQTVKLEEVLDRLETVLKEAPRMNPKTDDLPEAKTDKILNDFVNAKAVMEKLFKEHNVNVYQITLDDNNSYHTAGLLLYKENKPMSEGEAIYFDEKSNKSTRQEFAVIMAALQSEAVRSMQKIPGFGQDSNMDIKLLPDGQVEYLTVKNTPTYGIGTRAIINAMGLTAPYYVKTYVLSLDGHRSYAVLWCIDSERAFWNKTFKPVISSLK